MYAARHCIGCLSCCSHCDQGALYWSNGPTRDGSKCVLCGECTAACPTDAYRLVGTRVSVREVMDQIRRDVVFFDESSGGVTFSGGEPLAQPQFLAATAAACRNEGIHVAVETSGYASEDTIRRVAQYTDLFLYDLKMVDDTLHREYCGVSNVPILKNLAILAREHKKVIVRIPIIPSINDFDANIEESIQVIKSVGVSRIHLLAYHQVGLEKYRLLGTASKLEELTPPSSQRMQELAERFMRQGFEVSIGGRDE